MNDPWIRVPPDAKDHRRALLAAGALAAGVGVVTFYLTRLLLARERLLPEAPPGRPGGAEQERGGA